MEDDLGWVKEGIGWKWRGFASCENFITRYRTGRPSFYPFQPVLGINFWVYSSVRLVDWKCTVSRGEDTQFQPSSVYCIKNDGLTSEGIFSARSPALQVVWIAVFDFTVCKHRFRNKYFTDETWKVKTSWALPLIADWFPTFSTVSVNTAT